MATQFVTPVGRLVQGDPFKPQTTDKTGKPLTVKAGPNAGQPAKKWFIAVAFDKNNPEFGPFWQKIVAEAKAGFPQLVNQQGQITNPRFSWKLVDGDGVDADGNPNNVKPGFAGHWIVRFQSNYPPKLVHNGRYIDDAAAAAGAIKPGYYVTVAGDCTPNTGAEIPGLYMNLAAVELVGWGEEIRTGVDAVGAFSTAAAGRQYMPQGMLQQPPAPLPSMAMGQQPMQPGMPMQGQQPMQPGMPMQGQQPMQPGMPMQGQAPMQPGMPMQGQAPMQPGMPMQGQAPMQPGMPMQGQAPMQPGMPMQGQQPMQPGMPMQGQQPMQPGMPMQGQAPMQPGMPMQGQAPMQPGMPMQGQAPMQPGMPMQGQAPMQPGMPMQGQAPSQPNHAFVQNAIGQGMRAYGSDIPY